LSFFGIYFALGRLSAFSWQIFGTYLERKKELADFWNLVLVFLLILQEMLMKISQKSAEKSRNRNLDLRVANALTFFPFSITLSGIEFLRKSCWSTQNVVRKPLPY